MQRSNVARESAAQRAFMEWVRREPGCYGIKIHGDEYTRDQPDTIGTYRGRTWALEWKARGKKPTPSQESILRKWAAGGAIVGAPTSRDEAVALLRTASDVQ